MQPCILQWDPLSHIQSAIKLATDIKSPETASPAQQAPQWASLRGSELMAQIFNDIAPADIQRQYMLVGHCLEVSGPGEAHTKPLHVAAANQPDLPIEEPPKARKVTPAGTPPHQTAPLILPRQQQTAAPKQGAPVPTPAVDMLQEYLNMERLLTRARQSGLPPEPVLDQERAQQTSSDILQHQQNDSSASSSTPTTALVVETVHVKLDAPSRACYEKLLAFGNSCVAEVKQLMPGLAFSFESVSADDMQLLLQSNPGNVALQQMFASLHGAKLAASAVSNYGVEWAQMLALPADNGRLAAVIGKFTDVPAMGHCKITAVKELVRKHVQGGQAVVIVLPDGEGKTTWYRAVTATLQQGTQEYVAKHVQDPSQVPRLLHQAQVLVMSQHTAASLPPGVQFGATIIHTKSASALPRGQFISPILTTLAIDQTSLPTANELEIQMARLAPDLKQLRTCECSATVIDDPRLLTALEQTQNISLISASNERMKYADVIISCAVCVKLVLACNLNEPSDVSTIWAHVNKLSLAFQRVHIIIYGIGQQPWQQQQDHLLARLVLSLSRYTTADTSCRVSVQLINDAAGTAATVRQVLDTEYISGTPQQQQLFDDTEWIEERLSLHEKQLLLFTSLNSFSAQNLLNHFSIRDIGHAKMEQLSVACPCIPPHSLEVSSSSSCMFKQGMTYSRVHADYLLLLCLLRSIRVRSKLAEG